MNSSIKLNTKGFTLVELLVVMVIIAILGTVGVTAYVGSALKAARSEAYANLEALRMHEAQFAAENAVYTNDLTNDFRSFRPGSNPDNSIGPHFTYALILNQSLTTPVAIPFAGAMAAQTPCFVATATGMAGTRVAGDVFAIDCNNNRNF
ncbi:MAG: prepilin-type N-terminal cleavage/methylation domain-containing protein [Nitrospirota bacterium]